MGTVMVSVTRYRQYAADCVRQAQGEEAAEDKTIMLNVALAWLRLAHRPRRGTRRKVRPLRQRKSTIMNGPVDHPN